MSRQIDKETISRQEGKAGGQSRKKTVKLITTGLRSGTFLAHLPMPSFSHSTSTYLFQSVHDCSDRHTDKHYNWVQKCSVFSPLTLADVLPQHLHVLIAISAWLFVPEAQCVHQFVHYDAFLATTGTNRQELRARFRYLLTYWWPTPEKVLSSYISTVCNRVCEKRCNNASNAIWGITCVLIPHCNIPIVSTRDLMTSWKGFMLLRNLHKNIAGSVHGLPAE